MNNDKKRSYVAPVVSFFELSGSTTPSGDEIDGSVGWPSPDDTNTSIPEV